MAPQPDHRTPQLRERAVALVHRGRLALGHGRGRDPRTGRLVGALTTREALDAGWLTLGEATYGFPTVHVGPGDDGRVEIGAYCSIAREVEFVLGGRHRTDWVSTFPFRARFGLAGAYEDGHPQAVDGIVVGSDVWLAARASILGGVTIGHGAVVAASAVVTKDVRPYAIVGGNPARELRRRFSDEQVEALLRVAWWDWPAERVLAIVPELNGSSVAAFLAGHDPGAQAG